MFELQRLASIFTYRNALAAEHINEMINAGQRLQGLSRTSELLGDVIKILTVEDTTTLGIILYYRHYKGKTIPMLNPTGNRLMQFLWELDEGLDYEAEHPLVPIAKRFLEDAKNHDQYALELRLEA